MIKTKNVTTQNYVLLLFMVDVDKFLEATKTSNESKSWWIRCVEMNKYT